MPVVLWEVLLVDFGEYSLCRNEHHTIHNVLDAINNFNTLQSQKKTKYKKYLYVLFFIFRSGFKTDAQSLRNNRRMHKWLGWEIKYTTKRTEHSC